MTFVLDIIIIKIINLFCFLVIVELTTFSFQISSRCAMGEKRFYKNVLEKPEPMLRKMTILHIPPLNIRRINQKQATSILRVASGCDKREVSGKGKTRV